jgi:hypothetical protein
MTEHRTANKARWALIEHQTKEALARQQEAQAAAALAAAETNVLAPYAADQRAAVQAASNQTGAPQMSYPYQPLVGADLPWANAAAGYVPLPEASFHLQRVDWGAQSAEDRWIHAAAARRIAALEALVLELSRRPTEEQWRQLMASAARPLALTCDEAATVPELSTSHRACQHCGATFLAEVAAVHEALCELRPAPDAVEEL